MKPEITEYIKKKPAWQQDILKALRQLIHEGDPKVEEQIKWNSPYFSHNGKHIAWMFCAKEWVHFSLLQGALLDHSHGLFEETDNKAARTIKFRQSHEIPGNLIIKFIKDSAELIEEGKAIKFNVPKPGERTFNVPRQYAEFLKENRVWEDYQQRPYYQQKGWVQWVEQAKRPETKQKRKLTMLKELKDGTYMPPKRKQ